MNNRRKTESITSFLTSITLQQALVSEFRIYLTSSIEYTLQRTTLARKFTMAYSGFNALILGQAL